MARQKSETYPGDTIELAATMEVTGKGGAKAWVRVGLQSTQRQGETTEEATERIAGFVFESLDAYKEELKP